MSKLGRGFKYKDGDEVNIEEILTLCEEYIDSCQDEVIERIKTNGDKSITYEHVLKANMPTLDGLALHLNIHRATLYKWEKIYPEISDTLEQIRSLQKIRLMNSGVDGSYNSVIAKMLLSANHGLHEKKEVEIPGLGSAYSRTLSPSQHEVLAKLSDDVLKAEGLEGLYGN